MGQTVKIGLRNSKTLDILDPSSLKPYSTSPATPTNLQHHLQFSHLQEHVPSMTDHVDKLLDQRVQNISEPRAIGIPPQESRKSRGTNGKPMVILPWFPREHRMKLSTLVKFCHVLSYIYIYCQVFSGIVMHHMCIPILCIGMFTYIHPDSQEIFSLVGLWGH